MQCIVKSCLSSQNLAEEKFNIFNSMCKMQGKAKAALQLVALQSFLVALAVQGAWGRLASPKDHCWYDTVAAVAGTVFTRDDSACWTGEGGEDAEQEGGQRKQVLSSVQTCQCWCPAERQAVGRPCLTDFTERQTEGGREREREIDGCPARPLELRSIQAGVVSFPWT